AAHGVEEARHAGLGGEPGRELGDDEPGQEHGGKEVPANGLGDREGRRALIGKRPARVHELGRVGDDQKMPPPISRTSRMARGMVFLGSMASSVSVVMASKPKNE